MLRIVPVYIMRYLFSCMDQVSETDRIVDPVFKGFKERFNERIFVADF